jgi:hypothetical protein
MTKIEHTCNKCKHTNKRDIQWIEPSLFGGRPPEMKSNFWCSNFECNAQLSVLFRFEKDKKITVLKELEIIPIVLKDEPLIITARPRVKAH